MSMPIVVHSLALTKRSVRGRLRQPAVLAPSFIFRVEQDPPPGKIRRLDGFERFAVWLLAFLAVANVALAFAMCGFGACPEDPTGYWLFGGA